jgi:hypothetical protein
MKSMVSTARIGMTTAYTWPTLSYGRVTGYC